MITVFAALYYERTLAVTIGVIIAVVSLAPIFTTPPTGDGAHLLIEAPIHLGLAYIGQLMVGELIRHRRAHAELADELARASESQAIVIEAARTDPLTKLRNRSALNDEMQRLVEQHHTLGVPFSMLFLDIDHFKQINDRCGHICGDDILRQVAMLIRTQCRSTDVTARYGGEEFVMLLPGASGEVALKLGERVRAAVEQHRFWTPRSTTRLAITVSVGIAACPVNGTTADELLAHADAGMYSAKRAGRNQVRWPHDTQAPEHEASEMLQGVEA
jgi:two-component system cell cycle response regulator